MATTKKPAAKKAAKKKAAAAGTAAPRKTARTIPADAIAAAAPVPGKKLPKLVDEYILVSDLGKDQWQSLQAWAASNQITIDSFMVRYHTAVPYSVYEKFFMASK